MTGEKISRWERGLLDLTLRNSLLNVRMGRSAVELDERTETEVIEAARTGRGVSFSDAVSCCHFPEDVDGSKVMFRIASAARTYIAETGADPLYFGIGLLVWRSGKGNPKEYSAPLVLWGAELSGSKPSPGLVLGSREEQAGINHTLLEMLRRDFGVDIRPEDLTVDGVADIGRVFDVVREASGPFPGWRVEERVVLGLFSYHRYIIWNDLHSNWESVRRNSLVGSLDEGRLDKSLYDSGLGEAGRLLLPLEADSTQKAAIQAAVGGKSFVLHGPPGTGKSQTIANVIAGCLAEGKKVLFVSEKQAALNVVAGMLEEIGIGRYCLALHSGKIRKTALMRHMREVLSESGAGGCIVGEGNVRSDLDASLEEILEINDSLQRKRRYSLSARECISGYCGIGRNIPYRRLDLLAYDEAEAQDPGGALSAVRELQTICEEIGSLAGNRFRNLAHGNTESLLELRSGIDRLFERMRRLNVLKDSASDILFGGKAVGMNYGNLFSMRKLFGYLAEPDGLSDLDEETIFAIAPDALLGELNRSLTRGFLRRMIVRLKTARVLHLYSKVKWPPKIKELRTELERMIRTLRVTELYRQVSPEGSAPAPLEFRNILNAGGTILTEFSSSFDEVMEGLADVAPRILVSPELEYEGDWCLRVLSLRDEWIHQYQGLRHWKRYLELKKRLEERGLGEYVRDIDCGVIPSQEIQDSFMKSYYYTLTVSAIEEDSNLFYFDSALERSAGDSLRKLNAGWHTECCKAIVSRISSRVPDFSREASSDPMTVSFLRYLRNGCRGITIRDFIARTQPVIQKVCPCFMMNPSSVAQFLQPGPGQFDTVIIDEASQMPTSEALGAISRGGSTVIVGDPKQLPPTSFFLASQFDSAEEMTGEQESVLDDCLAISMSSRYLGWHYRSSHESLIAFSNAMFYSNDLKTFPTTDEKASRIRFKYVSGSYGRGSSRCNVEEADRVVADVRERLERGETATIGIVTFNASQQCLIEDKLSGLLGENPGLQRVAESLSEPIFVRNLENVQGDERDVIIFSIGYGPDRNGKVANTFGPLTREGGWRRLNVAVTRSREEMIVYSSLNPEDILCNEETGEGVRALRAFLQYVRDGMDALPQTEHSCRKACSDNLVLDIASEIEALGWKTVTDVGSSANSIDIGVCSPDEPDRFILGILCDSEKDMDGWIDRETVSIPVLEKRGWKLVHVWPPEWWTDRSAVLERISDELCRV